MREEENAPIRRPDSLKSELLRLIEQTGHHLGLTRTLNSHLRYLIRHTKESDWHGHNRAVVYKSVALMARQLGVSERQIYNREQLLVETLGLFVSGAGGRRYGRRDPATGQLLRACGVDLTNLRSLLPTLRKAAMDADADLAQWHRPTGLADRRARDGQVRNPEGYVRAMTRRTLTGDLRLSASVWGTVTHNGGHDAESKL